MSDWFPIVTGLENTDSSSVMYQVVKLELSNFGALVLSPAASSQYHMTDFLKTVPTRNLTGSTRRLSAVHEGRPYTPSATDSSYASQQFRGDSLRFQVHRHFLDRETTNVNHRLLVPEHSRQAAKGFRQ